MGNKASSAAAPGTAPQKLTPQEEQMLSKGIKRAPRDVSRKLETGGLVWNMKVVIRGAPSTGKSSLIRALQEKPFEPVYTPTKEIETHHIDWSYKATSEVVLVEAWDVIDSAQDKLVPVSSLPKDHPALSIPHDAPGPSPIGRRSSVKNMVELPCLDSTKIDVYRNSNAVIVLVDRTRLETYEYARKICQDIPPSLDVLILCSFRDHPAQKVVTDAHIQSLIQPNPALRRCIDVSFSNLYGIRQFQSFLNLPFLRMKQEFLEQQLSQTRSDMQTASTELDMLLEQSYDLYLQQVTVSSDQRSLPDGNEDDMTSSNASPELQAAAVDNGVLPSDQQNLKVDGFESFSALGNEVATAAVLDDFFGESSGLSAKTSQPSASISQAQTVLSVSASPAVPSNYESSPAQRQQSSISQAQPQQFQQPIILGEGEDALDDFYDGITVDIKRSNQQKRKSTSPRTFYGGSSESSDSSESETDSSSEELSEDDYDLEGEFGMANTTNHATTSRERGGSKGVKKSSADLGALFSEAPRGSEVLNDIAVNQKIAEAFRSAEIQAAAEAAALLAAQEAAAFDAAASLFESEDDELITDASADHKEAEKETDAGTKDDVSMLQGPSGELEDDNSEDGDDDELDLPETEIPNNEGMECDLAKRKHVDLSDETQTEGELEEPQHKDKPDEGVDTNVGLKESESEDREHNEEVATTEPTELTNRDDIEEDADEDELIIDEHESEKGPTSERQCTPESTVEKIPVETEENAEEDDELIMDNEPTDDDEELIVEMSSTEENITPKESQKQEKVQNEQIENVNKSTNDDISDDDELVVDGSDDELVVDGNDDELVVDGNDDELVVDGNDDELVVDSNNAQPNADAQCNEMKKEAGDESGEVDKNLDKESNTKTEESVTEKTDVPAVEASTVPLSEKQTKKKKKKNMGKTK